MNPSLIHSVSSSERLAQAMAQTFRHGKGPTSARPLTIALSRQAGAQGTTVARAVGQLLGWPVYDRELLQMVAERMDLRASLLESVDEKRKSWFQETMESIAAPREVTDTGFVHHLAQTLLALAAAGNCIIVGRGAAQVLPSATTLRVRLVGAREDRIEVIRKQFGLSRDEGARKVDALDDDRRHFVQDHFVKDPTVAEGYDLILNTSRFSVASCAELIGEGVKKLQELVSG